MPKCTLSSIENRVNEIMSHFVVDKLPHVKLMIKRMSKIFVLHLYRELLDGFVAGMVVAAAHLDQMYQVTRR
jgi:hypothetical protein